MWEKKNLRIAVQKNLTTFPINFPFTDSYMKILVLAHQHSHFYTDVFITYFCSCDMTDVRNNTNCSQRFYRFQQMATSDNTISPMFIRCDSWRILSYCFISWLIVRQQQKVSSILRSSVRRDIFERKNKQLKDANGELLFLAHRKIEGWTDGVQLKREAVPFFFFFL